MHAISEFSPNICQLRKVRSFARRQSRISAVQRSALLEQWSRFGLEAPGSALFDMTAIFGRVAPLYIEIGFGNGDTLLHLAALRPECNFLGIEVHRPGLGRVLNELVCRSINNVRVMSADAVEVLRHHIADGALAGVFIFFPDPWPKRRHHKRRLVQPPFIDLLAAKLIAGGVVHMATDWEHYAQHALRAFAACPVLRNQNAQGGFMSRPDYRPLTRFELRGQRLGNVIRDLVFHKV